MTIWGIPAAGIIVHGNIDSVSLTALRSSWTVSVVMIIGILAAMAVPGLAGAADAAKEARIRSDLQTIGSAVELYHVQHGAYPDSLDVLAESGNGKEGYLKSVPESPDEKTSYTLNTSTGKVTCTFNNKTYSSYGTSKASSGA